MIPTGFVLLVRRPLWEKIVGPFIWILERQQ